MASLQGRQISSTYKDILHVYNGTQNQGLEVTTKRVFDGEGVGSPLYLGTDFIEVGTSGNANNSNFKVWGDGSGDSQPYFLFNTADGNVFLENGDLTVDGKITATTIALADSEEDELDVFTIDNSGILKTTVPIESTNSITAVGILVGTGESQLKLGATNHKLSRGSDKGNIELKDKGISLQKNGVNLLEVNEEGEILPKSLDENTAFPTAPSDGSLCVKKGSVGTDYGIYVYNS